MNDDMNDSVNDPTDLANTQPYNNDQPKETDHDVITEGMNEDITKTLGVPADEFATELDGLAIDETEGNLTDEPTGEMDDKRNFVEDHGSSETI